ncbi:hypothetical protein BDN70DRAFT_976319 [Pholiota conissans]|uniref:Uncharacterized protein n=1 Tax=Pholiota conissans TaxID=109636 RepID=A0A9P6CSU9_9AGAR|nr:hypothetical protein BDN70DRAFT_976319 [Pholiota conissans]
MKQLEYLTLAWTYKYGLDAFLDEPGITVPDSAEALSHVDNVHLDKLRKLVLVATIESDIMRNLFSKLVVPNSCISSVTIAHFPETAGDPLFYWLQDGIDRRVDGWSKVGIPFYITMLAGARQYGFRIDHHARLQKADSDSECHAFEFRCLDYSGCFSGMPIVHFKHLLAKAQQEAAEPWLPLTASGKPHASNSRTFHHHTAALKGTLTRKGK